ncbi:carbon-nitrogen hydrolase family protein [Bacteroidota bacterium]
MKHYSAFIIFICLALIFDSEEVLAGKKNNNPPVRIRVAGLVLKWVPENLESNFIRAKKLIIEASENGADIICSSECFLDGYAIRNESLDKNGFKKLAQKIPGGKYIKRLKNIADSLDIFLVLGLSEEEGDKIYNSSIIIDQEGEIILKYRKVNLWGPERKIYSSGKTFPVCDSQFGKFGMMICYDRQFPTPVQELAKNKADVIFCLSGGSTGRYSQDLMLLRSEECGVPIVLVNPCEFLVSSPEKGILKAIVAGDNKDYNPRKPENGEVIYYDLNF